MLKIDITENQFINAYRSAGLWFVALYMEAFLLRMNELRDRVKKTHLIEEIYNNGNGPDKYESGTRTRVNCLQKIIESERVIQALEIAAYSPRLMIDFPNAVIIAKETLDKINRNELDMLQNM